MNDATVAATQPRTVFIACAALTREVRAIIDKHGWEADIEAIDATLHFHPKKIGPAVEQHLERTAGSYERRIVVYGLCGAFDLDRILEKHGAVRPLGPHCYEQFGGEEFGRALEEEPGTYFLTDFLVRTWDKLVIKRSGLDRRPAIKELLFRPYKRLVYFAQDADAPLLAKAGEIAQWLGLPLEVRDVGCGDLERRLVAIMEGREQPISSRTHDGRRALAPAPVDAAGARP